MATKQAWCCRMLLPPNGRVDYRQEGDVILYANGTFRIHNRLFDVRQPVNYQWSGCHAQRESKDNRLSVTAGGEHFVYEYSFGVWYRWVAIAMDAQGTVETSQLPRTPAWHMPVRFLVFVVGTGAVMSLPQFVFTRLYSLFRRP